MYQDDKKVRKHWLWLTLLYYCGFGVLLAVVGAVEAITVFDPTVFLILLVPLGFSLLGFWPLFHCAYRKYGTKYLTFKLALVLLGCVVGLVSLCFQPAMVLAMPGPEFVIGLALLGILAWWCILSFKLRALNKKVRLNRAQLARPAQ